MVSITSAARANLLALIAANQEQDDVASKMVSGKRVSSVADNAFSYFQARGLESRASTLTMINDRLNIGVRAVDQAAAAGKKITKNLDTVKGILDDIKSKGASAQVNTSTVTGNSGSVFNKAGSATAPINDSTILADTSDLGTSADGGAFVRTGLTTTSDLASISNTGTNVNASAGALSGAAAIGSTNLVDGSNFAANDIIKISNGTQSVFVKVLAAATAYSATTVTGENKANAIEVKTLDDLRNILSGRQRSGTALAASQTLGFVATIDTSGAAGARFKIAQASLTATTSVTASFELERNTGNGTDLASTFGATLFGGSAATQTAASGTGTDKLTYTNSTLTIAAPTVLSATSPNAGLTVNDIIAVRVGTGTSARSIFTKVVSAFTGPNTTQAGDGLSESSAIEVKSMADLANALSGKRSDGVNDISADPLGTNAFGVFVRTDANGSALKVSSSVSAKFTIKRADGTNTYAASKTLFGGTADTAVTDFANGGAANNMQATAVAATVTTNGMVLNDIISIDVGTGANIRTLYMKVVGNYSGASGAQAGNGAGNGVGADSPLEIRTIGDFRNAINGLSNTGAALADQGFAATGIRATFDSSNSTGAAATRLSITTNQPMKFNIDRFGAVAGTVNNVFGGSGGALTTPAVGPGRSTFTITQTVNTTAKEQRLSAATAYRNALNTIQGIVDDAQVNGINLLRDSTGYTAVLSETTTTNFALRSNIGGDAVVTLGFTKSSGVLQDGAENDFAANTDVDKAIAKLDAALASLGGRDTELEVIKAIVSERKSFNADIIESLGNLSSDLTAVNQEEATAQASAASFSANAALKFLSISSQRSSQLLQLF